MYRVDITVDLNDEDHTGYVWTLLDEARDPAQISGSRRQVDGELKAFSLSAFVQIEHSTEWAAGLSGRVSG